MQPLLLIKQTIEKPFDPGALAIDGPLARFTNADQFFSRSVSKASTKEFSVTFEHGSAKVTFTYGRSAALGIDLVRISFDRGKKKYTWKNGQALNKDHERFWTQLRWKGLQRAMFDTSHGSFTSHVIVRYWRQEMRYRNLRLSPATLTSFRSFRLQMQWSMKFGI